MNGVDRSLASAAVLSLCLAANLSAQTLRGRVVDAKTGLAVSGAAVRLVASDSVVVWSGLTGDAGAFTATAPSGEYWIGIERLGYATASAGPLRLRDGGLTDMTFELELEAIPLDSIRVEVSAGERFLRNAGFYNRQKVGIGQFIDRSQIEASKANDASDVLEREATGIRTVRRFGFADVQVRPGVSISMGFGGQSATCAPLIYLNGSLVAPNTSPSSAPQDWGNGRFNLENLLAHDIEAIEVYTGMAQAPAQYARSGAPCGVVLIWTRH